MDQELTGFGLILAYIAGLCGCMCVVMVTMLLAAWSACGIRDAWREWRC